jgi:hypothetical protein
MSRRPAGPAKIDHPSSYGYRFTGTALAFGRRDHVKGAKLPACDQIYVHWDYPLAAAPLEKQGGNRITVNIPHTPLDAEWTGLDGP